MAKQYKKTPLLDRVIKARNKENAPEGIKWIIAGILSLAVLAGLVLYGIIPFRVMLCFIFAPVTFIIMGVTLFSTRTSFLKAIKNQLGITHNEELETILEKCEKLDDYVFMSDRYIIDLHDSQIIDLSDIEEAENNTYYVKDAHRYMVHLKMRNGSSRNIFFTEMISRDSARCAIGIAAALAEGKKCID